MRRRFHILSLSLIIALAALSGCSSQMKTKYVDDTTSSEATTLYFSHKDLQLIADAMVDDLLKQGYFKETPLIRISQVNNKTDEHIDTKAITDSIRTRLLRSGEVRFVADVSEKGARQEMVNELKFGESPLADSSKSPEVGKMQAAKYHLFGDITSTETTAGRVKEKYFKMTLSLAEVETGVLVWANEKEILKQGRKQTLGW
jgi:uncharacterized protein (TIGR02722 family)